MDNKERLEKILCDARDRWFVGNGPLMFELVEEIAATNLLAPEWQPITDAPMSRPVLCKRDNRIFVGKLVGRFELEMDIDADDAGEWDESGDNFYALPGWFEQAAEHEDVAWWAIETPEWFQPIPAAPKDNHDE